MFLITCPIDRLEWSSNIAVNEPAAAPAVTYNAGADRWNGLTTMSLANGAFL